MREQLLPKVPANQTLEKILFVTAGEVRRLRIRSETLRDRQIFCVLDDCTTDKEGNSHPEHAVIGLCIAHAWKEESDELQMAVEGLKVLFNAAAATQ